MSPEVKWLGNWALWTLATVGLAFAVLVPDAIVHVWVSKGIGMDRAMAMPWIALFCDHAVMTLTALILIALLSKGRRGNTACRSRGGNRTWPLRSAGGFSSAR